MDKTLTKYDILNFIHAALGKMKLGADSWAAGAEALQACALLEKMLRAEDEARQAERKQAEEVTEDEHSTSD